MQPSPEDLVMPLAPHLERVFGLPVVFWQGRERPAGAYDPSRHQHSSIRILEWLGRVAPADARKVLAVTDVDLFIPILTFVFGEAQLNGRAAVVSLARLVPPEAGSAPGRRVLAARLRKEAAHEIGHAFGLTHCDRVHCVMSRSASLLEVDTKTDGLCRDCWMRYLELREQPGGLP